MIKGCLVSIITASAFGFVSYAFAYSFGWLDIIVGTQISILVGAFVGILISIWKVTNKRVFAFMGIAMTIAWLGTYLFIWLAAWAQFGEPFNLSAHDHVGDYR